MTNYDTLKEYEEHNCPVPSYEEWKTAYECVVSENEEITMLKELLKELCANVDLPYWDEDLLRKLDEVLK